MQFVARHFRPMLVAVLGAALAVAQPARAADPQSDAREIINRMGAAVIATLRAGADKSQREATFRQLYRQHFDNAGIGAWAAGRAFNAASPAARQEYLQVFESYIVKAYSAQLSKYRGERLRVDGAEVEGHNVIVDSKLVHPDPRAMRDLELRWRMHRVGGRWMIIDVIIDKISMGLTERRAFADWLRQGGGTLEALTAKLREKIAEVDGS
jgi:phospholipid transport system substrate-binding protein